MYTLPFNIQKRLRQKVVVPERSWIQTFADTWLMSTFQTGVEYNPGVDELSHCANQRQPAVIDGVREQRRDSFLTGTLSFTRFKLGFTRRIYAE